MHIKSLLMVFSLFVFSVSGQAMLRSGATAESIWFNGPLAGTITVDEELSNEYESTKNIDALIKLIAEKGPVIALGSFGPAFYLEDPFKLRDSVKGYDVFGWRPGTARRSGLQPYVAVIGARKVGEAEYVYFSLTKDITPNTMSPIRTYEIAADKRIFVVSHRTFWDYLNRICTPKLGNSAVKHASAAAMGDDSDSDPEFFEKARRAFAECEAKMDVMRLQGIDVDGIICRYTSGQTFSPSHFDDIIQILGTLKQESSSATTAEIVRLSNRMRTLSESDLREVLHRSGFLNGFYSGKSSEAIVARWREAVDWTDFESIRQLLSGKFPLSRE